MPTLAALKALEPLLQNNRAWAADMVRTDPDFFSRLSHQQNPEYLWIGCSDSRVPANQIVGLLPGEVFVHRNVANLVVHTDLNCLSVIQYAVEVLQVRHIIVCGHYGCGGVRATLNRDRVGLVDNWLRHVEDVRQKHAAQMSPELPAEVRCDRLCELNVIEQVLNVAQTTVVRDAWERRQPLDVHGWVYALKDGLIRDLHLNLDGQDDLPTAYEEAVRQLPVLG